MISLFRTALTILTAIVATTVLGAIVISAALLGLEDKPGGIFDNIPRWWSASVLWAAGIRVHVHGMENSGGGESRIFASNHVSWFDVPALSLVLPHNKFVAKAELFKVPVFGRAMRAAGMIEMQRDNRKAAFGAYDVAAERIRAGSSVVVFPEGTRGHAYPLRAFKKGPFVLAIAAGVPIVPVILHGTIEINRKGSLRIHPGTIHIHLLEPASTSGVDYDHRAVLMTTVRTRMADALRELYGVHPLPPPASRPATTADLLSPDTEPTETA